MGRFLSLLSYKALIPSYLSVGSYKKRVSSNKDSRYTSYSVRRFGEVSDALAVCQESFRLFICKLHKCCKISERKKSVIYRFLSETGKRAKEYDETPFECAWRKQHKQCENKQRVSSENFQIFHRDSTIRLLYLLVDRPLVDLYPEGESQENSRIWRLAPDFVAVEMDPANIMFARTELVAAKEIENLTHEHFNL